MAAKEPKNSELHGFLAEHLATTDTLSPVAFAARDKTSLFTLHVNTDGLQDWHDKVYAREYLRHPHCLGHVDRTKLSSSSRTTCAECNRLLTFANKSNNNTGLFAKVKSNLLQHFKKFKASVDGKMRQPRSVRIPGRERRGR